MKITRTARTAPTARRTLLRASAATAAAGVLAAGSSPVGATPRTPAAPLARPTAPAAALKELAAGNRRWRTLRQRHPHEAVAVRNSPVSGQAPFALILGCIDSRVPPELVFDQGLGGLMTLRSAGEVLDEAVLGSIAYGVLEPGIPLVVVLGHQSCGAVAAVHAEETGEHLPAHIQYVADQIRPAIDRDRDRSRPTPPGAATGTRPLGSAP
ncbi:carbonic anhydrase [Streptomyces bacillaris]|uniref:carbonic anhydrase n=1 Tax=Streptomyces bacillaris TaxID=68179 RepID=UPI003461738B